MSFEVWLSFTLASFVLVVTPGPTVILVVAQSLARGPSSARPLILGVLAGDLLALLLSLVGLGALLSLSSVMFDVLKYAGAAYLIYLGISNWRSGSVQINSDAGVVSDTAFRDAFWVTALNPKGMIFFVAFFPVFVNSEAALIPQLLTMACTFMLVSAVSVTGYAYCSTRLEARLQTKNSQGLMSRCSGALLVSLGLLTASVQRN